MGKKKKKKTWSPRPIYVPREKSCDLRCPKSTAHTSLCAGQRKECELISLQACNSHDSPTLWFPQLCLGHSRELTSHCGARVLVLCSQSGTSAHFTPHCIFTTNCVLRPAAACTLGKVKALAPRSSHMTKMSWAWEPPGTTPYYLSPRTTTSARLCY